MSDFAASPQIFGSITSAVLLDAGDLPGITLLADRKLEAWQPTLIDASTSGSVDLELWTEAGGAGGTNVLLATATFNAGSVVPDSSPIAAPGTAPAGTTIILRITAIGTDAGGLSGSIVLETVVSGSGVTQLLTTSARVNLYDPRTVDMDPAFVDDVIAGVSDWMVRWMARQITMASLVEYPRIGDGVSAVFALSEYPVSNVVIEEAGSTLVDGTGYRVDLGDGEVTKLAGTWFPNVKVTYDAGYAEVPESLVNAATKQCSVELHRGDRGLFGVTQRDPEAGATLTFDDDGFLPSTIQAMRPFYRIKV